MITEVLAAIHTHYLSFTPVERDVADYVLAHGYEVVYMPITELAYRCSVGETSIVRFCRRLGQPGYQAFRLALASSVQEHRLFADAYASETSDPYENCAEKVYQKHMTALSSTRKMMPSGALKAAAEHIRDAREVYFFGLNHSVSATVSACQTFLRVLRKGVCAMEPSLQHSRSESLTPSDAAVFFSHCGKNDETLRMASNAKRAKAYTVAVTCCGESPLHKLCDVGFSCGCTADPTHPTELDQLTGKATFSYVIETLCAACVTSSAAAR